MNKVLLFLALSMGLHTTAAQSMEQTQKTALMGTFKNSPAAQWLNKYKMPLMIGIGGLLAAKLTYSYLATSTPEQLKEQIRTKFADKIKIEASEVRNMHNRGIQMTRGALLMDHDPYYGYNIKIITVAEPESEPKFFAQYYYNCDKTTEDVEILFDDQEASLLNS